ncbi:hypothetical protein INT48_002979, partial [Thamnidium elegans]
MGRISNKKKAWVKNLRNVRNFPEQVTEQQSDISSVNDEPVQIIDEAALQSINFKLKEDGVSKREAFSRGLEYSARYQRKLKQKNREMAKGSAKISSYFSSVTASSASEEAPVETEMQKLQAAYDYLTSELEPKISLESAQQKAGTYERTKYLAVHLYLELRIDGINIVIRKYVAEYIITGEITKGLQGKHSKRISILDDNDIKRKVIEWFRSVPKFQRNIPAIQNELRHVIIPNAIENNALNVERYSNAVTSIECIRKKLIEWGFHFKRVGRVIFFDGHEREDVVAYRNEWSKRIMLYREYSETYSYDDVSIVIPPILPTNVRQHVFVTHDESTFYANDHQQYAWLEETENFCLPKSQGRSIMISEFHCPCHGTMRAMINGKPMTSRVVFYPGAPHQGYWTSEHMITQLKDVLSSNHKAFAKDALVASRMNMGGGEVKEDDVKVRDGRYTVVVDSQSVEKRQSFYVERNFNYPELQKLRFSKISRADKV